MIMLVQKSPANLKPKTAEAIIIIIGVSARLLFLAYPAGNDIYRYIDTLGPLYTFYGCRQWFVSIPVRVRKQFSL